MSGRRDPVSDVELRDIAAAADAAPSVKALMALTGRSERIVSRALALYAPERAVYFANHRRGPGTPTITLDDIRQRAELHGCAPGVGPRGGGPSMAMLERYRARTGRLPPHVRGMPESEPEAALALAMAARALARLLDAAGSERPHK